MRMSVETLIDAPPHVVFAILADIQTWPLVLSAIVEVTLLTPGPVAVGTRFRETREMFGRKATEEMTVAEIEPPRRLVLTAFNHGTAYRVEHLLAAEGLGTRVTLAFEGRPVTLGARLLMPLGLLFAGTVRRQLRSDLADLGREAERRHRHGAPRSA
jgi:uncharacterized protein YndB with AHSA1/START domain